MTHPTDAAIAQAFRERLESMYSPLTVREVMKAVEDRARELDAEKGGLTEAQKVERDAYLYGTGFMRDGKHIPAQEVMVSCRHDWVTDGMGDYCRYCKKREDSYIPPAQAAEAVERVARAIFGNKWMSPRPDWETLHESTRDEYRAQARAAIAAMREGE